MSDPANQRKLDAVEKLALLAQESDITLMEMAVAFVINHPGVTAAIIGPRTMSSSRRSSQPPAFTLSPDVLDRIGQTVAPGVTVNPV